MPPRPPVTPESIARGATLYAENGCAACHGDDLRGGQWLQDAKGYPVISRDLTAPWTFRGGDAPEEVFLRLSTGLAPGPMPAYAALPADSRWDLVSFLESRRRAPPWQSGKLDGPGEARDLEVRGRYLVHAEMCGLCHTELDPAMIYRDDRYLAGGMRVGAYPQGTFITRNLTSDPDTGLGRWSEAEIARAIRDGVAKDGRLLNFWGMPWPWLHNLSVEDARAIGRYLKTLPPVHNAIPLPLHYGVVETIAAKIWFLSPMIGRAPTLTYDIGSYANMPPPDLAAITGWLTTAQWLVVVIGLVLFAVASRRSLPRSFGGWARLTGIVVAGLVVFAVGYFVDKTPTVSVLPPDKIADAVSTGIPRPDLTKLGPARAALVARGRYIFANASCAYCHGNDGSGGLKVSGPFGTMFTANISSDREAGLGRLERCRDRPRGAQRRRQERPAAVLAGHAVGSLLQPRRRGRGLADRLSAGVAADRRQSAAAPVAGARRLQDLHILDQPQSRAGLPVDVSRGAWPLASGGVRTVELNCGPIKP